MCIGMCMYVCIDVCMDMCIGMCIDIRIDMCVDIRIDMCVDIDITATYPLCMDMWVHARMHEGKEEYRDDRAGLCRLDTWHPIAVWHGRVAWRCAMAVRHGCVRACVRTRACAR